MYLASDNSGPAHPKVIEALTRANEGHALPYGADPLTEQVCERIREVLEAPEAAVYLVALGTAANSLALATLSNPWDTVFCHRLAHIHEDECNAPEFYTGGAKLTLVDGPDAKMTPEALTAAIAAEDTRGVHGPQRGPVSLTNVTERGTLYSLSEIEALTGVAHGYDLPVHLDGARFANALVATNATPAAMSWRAGVDALSFGGTKNGLMCVEAVVFFDPAHAHEFELRRKRAAHLFSKQRFLAAQMDAALTDDLWLDMARAANAAAARLTAGLRQIGAGFLFEPEANILFVTLPRKAHRRLQEAGAQYILWAGELDGDDDSEPLAARLVTNWATTNADIDRFIDLADG